MNGISIITQVFPGERCINRLLSTFLNTNTYEPFEWLIFNSSGDNWITKEIKRYSAEYFIRCIEPRKRLSKAEMRNICSGIARFDNLLFLDSTIEFRADVIQKVINALLDERVGAVGIRINDNPDYISSGRDPSIQHLGITFNWDKEKLFFRPVNISHRSVNVYENSINHTDYNNNYKHIVPAVSGTFLLCKKPDFKNIGGFCEAYINSFDDVDFCLRLKSELGKQCICISDISLPNKKPDNVNKINCNKSLSVDELEFKVRMGDITTAIMRQELQISNNRLSKSNIPYRRILFVLPALMESSIGDQAQSIARLLNCEGVECILAVPDMPVDFTDCNRHFMVQSYDNINKYGPGFQYGLEPDIIHVWTPREHVRIFSSGLLTKYPAKLVIHLSENEEYLIEQWSEKQRDELKDLSEEELDKIIPGQLYHPRYGQIWLGEADGIINYYKTEDKLNFKGNSYLDLPPIVDERLFYPRPINYYLRGEYNIPEENIVLVYAVDISKASLTGIEKLCHVIIELNNQDIPATLIRTGAGDLNLINEINIEASPYVIDIGFTKRHYLPDIMAMADLYVHPLDGETFSNLNLQGRLIEFMAIGRPVIMPNKCPGFSSLDQNIAYLLDDTSLDNIISVINRLKSDTKLNHKLSLNAPAFIRAHYDPRVIIKRLIRYYETIFCKKI